MDAIAAALETIKNFFTSLWDYLTEFPGWVIDNIKVLFLAIWEIQKDFFTWILESVFDAVIAILNSLDFDFSLFNPNSYIAGIGTDSINIMGLLQIPEAVAIILAAIVIRLILQLIPFVRLGS